MQDGRGRCGDTTLGSHLGRACRPQRAFSADCRLGELGVNVGTYGMEPWILSDDTAARLWDLSEELVGVEFG